MLKHTVVCAACQQEFCEIHAACETEGCGAWRRRLTTRQQLISEGIYSPRTQKAKGYIALYNQGGLGVPYPYYLVTADGDYSRNYKKEDCAE